MTHLTNKYSPILIKRFITEMKKQENQHILSTGLTPNLWAMSSYQNLVDESSERPEYIQDSCGIYPRDIFEQLAQYNPLNSDLILSYSSCESILLSKNLIKNQKFFEQNLRHQQNSKHSNQYQESLQDSKKEEEVNKDMNYKSIKKQFLKNQKQIIIDQTLPIVLKKNVNMPKAVGRYAIKYFEQFGTTLFQNNKQFFSIIKKQLNQLHIWTKKSKTNTFRLKNLVQLFDSSSKTFQQCKINRMMMKKILIKHLRQQIIPNQQVKDKKEYLIGLKVYALRCANAKLATRMQMR